MMSMMCFTDRLKGLRRQSDVDCMNETSFLSQSLLDGSYVMINLLDCVSQLTDLQCSGNMFGCRVERHLISLLTQLFTLYLCYVRVS